MRKTQAVNRIGLNALADMLYFLDRTVKKLGVVIVGGQVQITCPYCFDAAFSINLLKKSGRCGRCRREIVDLKDYEVVYLYSVKEMSRAQRREDDMRQMMEKGEDIIY